MDESWKRQNKIMKMAEWHWLGPLILDPNDVSFIPFRICASTEWQNYRFEIYWVLGTLLCHLKKKTFFLKRHWTLLVIVKDQSSHLVYLNICIRLSSIRCRSCEIIMKEQTPLSHEVVCFQMLDFETSNSKSEVSKSNSWKITSFSKRGSCFLQCFILSSSPHYS